MAAQCLKTVLKKVASMLKKAAFPGKYIQGMGAMSELPSPGKLLGQQG
jgi:hypothetical protein